MRAGRRPHFRCSHRCAPHPSAERRCVRSHPTTTAHSPAPRAGSGPGRRRHCPAITRRSPDRATAGGIVKEMPSHLERPITVALSTPPAGAEATPTGLLMWTDGRASIATGRPFPPVTYQDVTYVVAQVNHSKPLPGPGLGAIVSRARRISDGIFAAAAANAVSSLVRVRQSGASLLPHIKDLHSVPVTVAVAGAAKADGLAGVKFSHIVQHGQDVLAWPGPAGGQLRTEHLPPRVRVFA